MKSPVIIRLSDPIRNIIQELRDLKPGSHCTLDPGDSYNLMTEKYPDNIIYEIINGMDGDGSCLEGKSIELGSSIVNEVTIQHWYEFSKGSKLLNLQSINIDGLRFEIEPSESVDAVLLPTLNLPDEKDKFEVLLSKFPKLTYVRISLKLNSKCFIAFSEAIQGSLIEFVDLINTPLQSEAFINILRFLNEKEHSLTSVNFNQSIGAIEDICQNISSLIIDLQKKGISIGVKLYEHERADSNVFKM